MKQSKEQLKKALVTIGTSLDMKKATEYMIDDLGIHSVARELVIKMFVESKYEYFEKDDNVFEAIQILRKYLQELTKNGEVIFNEPYPYSI